MNKILINSTKLTPEITFDREFGNLSFKGKSYPENPDSFYKTIALLVDQLKICKAQTVSFYMNLDFFSAGTARCLYRIFRSFNELKSLGKQLDLNWYYEADDQEMLEIGEDFASGLSLNINFVPCLKRDTVMDNFIKI